MSMSETKGIARGVYPIDTGKVLIGRDYIPRQPHYTTQAEFFWQGVLLGKKVKPHPATLIRAWVFKVGKLIKGGK